MLLQKIPLFVFLLLYLNLAAQHWQVTPMASMPERVSNSAVAAGNVNGADYVYSFAGIDSTKLYSGIHLKGYRYNVQENTWEIIPPLPDNMGKIAASADRVGNVIYIIGGYHVFSNGSETSSNKVHRYDMMTNTYLTDGAPIPKAIDDQVQAVWRDSLIYVVTGWSNNGNVPDVQIYDPSNDLWMAGTSTPNNNNYKSFGSSGVIFNDTIYYFGGARSSGNFGIQNDFRKGIINPNIPTEIEWSTSTLGSDVNGYRMAATISGDAIYWIGGSGNTYNFDGIAYNNGTGVEPLNRSLSFLPGSNLYQIEESTNFPMDLRGLGSVNDTLKFIVGGMVENQEVTNQAWRLVAYVPLVGNDEIANEEDPMVFPNPVTDRLFLRKESLPLKKASYEIYNTFGQVVLTGSFDAEGIDVTRLAGGVYFLTINENGQITTLKFIKR